MQRKIIQVAVSHDAQLFAQRIMVQFEEKKKELQTAIENMTECNIRNQNKELTDQETQEYMAQELNTVGEAMSADFKMSKHKTIAKLAATTTIWQFITHRVDNYANSDEIKTDIDNAISSSQMNIIPKVDNLEPKQAENKQPFENNNQESLFSKIQENFKRLSSGIWKILTSDSVRIGFGVGLSAFCASGLFLDSTSAQLLVGGIASAATVIAYQAYIYYKNLRTY